MPTHPPHGCGPWLFVLIWTAGVALFDGLAGVVLWQQARTYDFAETEGVVTRSQLKSHREPKGGTTESLDVAYDYEVDGRRYTGTRYCYGAMGTGDATWSKVQRQLPVGKTVPVYHDPADPADAVLHRGPTGMTLFLFWFLTPFNVVMVVAWAHLLRNPRPRFDPRHVAATPTGWAVRLPGAGRLAVFAGVLLGVTFVGSLVIVFTGGFNPPVGLMGWAFAGAFAAAALAALLFARHPRLEVDDIARVVRLPPGGRGAEEVPFADVREVAVAEEQKHGPKGATWVEYRCELHRADADTPTRLATYRERADAEALAAWLREKVGLPAR